jgi:hypothetical protein
MPTTESTTGAEHDRFPSPPFRLYGLPCTVCQYPAVAWWPGRYFEHGDGIGCILAGATALDNSRLTARGQRRKRAA